MNKFLFLVLVLAFSLMLPISSYANLLSNGGFENGTGENPDNWWKWSNNWGWAGWNSGGAHSGDKYVYAGGNNSAPPEQFAIFGQNLGASSGDVYTFSVWAKTENWGTPTGSLRIEFKDEYGENIRVDTLELFGGAVNDTWTQYTLVAASAPVGTVTAQFLCYGGSSGTAQFDDAEVTIPEPASIMLLSGLALFLRRK
jgi:hypothetical protein